MEYCRTLRTFLTPSTLGTAPMALEMILRGATAELDTSDAAEQVVGAQRPNSPKEARAWKLCFSDVADLSLGFDFKSGKEILVVSMLVRRALALAFAGALVGCGASAVPGTNAVSGTSAASGTNASSVLRSPLFVSPDSTPKIKKVSPIAATQYQQIVIKGKGFGKMQPYNGDSCCIQIVVTNPECYYYQSIDTWRAGYEGSGNEVTLNVAKWTNKKIVITGFTGLYGSYCWYLVSGYPITINVWNAQSQAGPATWTGTVQ